MGQIVIFSKSACPHCVDAKAILNDIAVPFVEIDIEEKLENSMLMSLVSKRHTVPQIFFNDQHIGGAHELKQLSTEKLEQLTQQAIRADSPPEFLTSSYDLETLRNAVIPIKDYLDPHLPKDFTHLPEYKAVELWYSQMFGFLCNCYDQMTLKPEPMSLYIPVLSSMMRLVSKEVSQNFGIACLATAYAADCSYCAAHGADLSMKYGGQSDVQIKHLYDYLRGDITYDDLPFDDELKITILLASRMASQEISQEDMELTRKVFGVERLRGICHSVAGMGGIMGFLNRWNDLIGVEIEASIKQTIDNSALAENWDWGTHDTEDDENRHIYRDPKAKMPPPSREQFAQLVNKVRDDVFEEAGDLMEKYLQFDQALLPAWIAVMPDEDSTRSVSAFYHASLNAGELPSELKHVAAYAMTLGAGYPGMAEEERRIAEMVSENPAELALRLVAVEKMATGEIESSDLLSSAEIIAIKLARSAQTFPHIVRGELVTELAREFSPAQIVELVLSLAVLGIGQRWTGVIRPFDDYVNNNSSL